MINVQTANPINSRYRLLEKLGEGGMGAVYRALDRLTGQMVALKRVTASGDLLDFASKGSGDSDFRLALATEFRTLAGLRHPHIVSVLDYGFDEQRQPYFTMHLIEAAKSLTEYGAELDTAGKVRLLTEMLQALAYLHRRDIIHRDLKPGNVLVTADGSIKVMDFGLALNTSDSITSVEASGVGTLTYMAPELFADEPATVQTDLYAVGVMAYELFVGQYPYHTKNMALLVNGILNEKPETGMLDPELAKILDRLLAKSPTDRYNSANDVIEAFCMATGQALPQEDTALRESYLQAAKFVGRDAELNRLIAALDALRSSKGSTWLIGGESGVGKSRLLSELRSRALVAGAIVVHGQGVDGGGLPYQLWRDPLRRLVLPITLSDLEAGVLKALIPDLDHLTGRAVPDAPDLPGTAGQQRLSLTIADVFKRQQSPVVLLLEDLQWTSESLVPLKRLNDLTRELPLLIVGTYRDDEAPALPGELPDMQVMKLTRLSDEELTELSVSMLGDAGRQAELIDLLKRETEGNTLFMVEVVRTLAEEAGRLSDIQSMSLPRRVMAGGIQQILRRRLGRVPEALQPLLRLAAVAGRQIDLKVLELLERMQADGVPSGEFLNTCAGAAILEAVDDRWRFTHDRLRETVLSNLATDERSALHRKIAEAIEQVYPGDNSYADVLMEHYYGADEPPKVLHYTRIVCERLIEYVADYTTAQHLLTRGLELANRLPEEERAAAQAVLHKMRGDASEKQSDYSAARIHYQMSLQLVQDNLLVRTGALLGMARVESYQRNYKTAIEYAAQARETAETLNNPYLIAFSLNNLGNIVDDMADFAAARAYYEESLTIRRTIGDQTGIARSLNNLGIIANFLGEYASARAYHEQSLAIKQKTGDRNGIARSLNNLGVVAYNQGDYAAAMTYYSQSMATTQEIGDRWGTASALLNMGLVANGQGDYATSQDYLEESLQIAREIGDPISAATTLSNLGELAYLQKDYVIAQSRYEEALVIAREIGDDFSIAIGLNNLGSVNLALGEIMRAKTYLVEGLKLASALKIDPLVLELIIHFAHVRLLAQDTAGAAAWLGLAVTHPAVRSETLNHFANPLQAKLKVQVSAEALNAALETGRSLSLDMVVQQILAEYELKSS